ncbi:unnamed protein product [Sphagnum balticum]
MPTVNRNSGGLPANVMYTAGGLTGGNAQIGWPGQDAKWGVTGAGTYYLYSFAVSVCALVTVCISFRAHRRPPTGNCPTGNCLATLSTTNGGGHEF